MPARSATKRGLERVEFDMTPMIDCTFQLVIFFMLSLNFSMDEQSELIRLPFSELAKPPEGAVDTPLTLQLTSRGNVLLLGEELALSRLSSALLRERQVIERTPGKSLANVTVIIRADREVPMGKVQEVIKLCQEVKFEKFVLRAKERAPDFASET